MISLPFCCNFLFFARVETSSFVLWKRLCTLAEANSCIGRRVSVVSTLQLNPVLSSVKEEDTFLIPRIKTSGASAAASAKSSLTEGDTCSVSRSHRGVCWERMRWMHWALLALYGPHLQTLQVLANVTKRDHSIPVRRGNAPPGHELHATSSLAAASGNAQRPMGRRAGLTVCGTHRIHAESYGTGCSSGS